MSATLDRLPRGDSFADDRIFISIASYRDPDLPRTISNAIETAARPARLRFGICHQYDTATERCLAPWADDPRFEIDALSYLDSRGVGFARSRVQDLYDHEPYYLQIDAHMRFAERWDERCITMLESTDSVRPIITNYPIAFKLRPDGSEEREAPEMPRRLGLEPSRPPGSLRQRSEPAGPADRPGRHHFLAAGHIFTIGRFCRDVPYDPSIYYEGEEISLAVRAYTHGYDLFWPNENVLWHWYDHDAPLHWTDHADHQRRHESTELRVRRLLAGDDGGMGVYGLGSRRTVGGYERLSAMALPPEVPR